MTIKDQRLFDRAYDIARFGQHRVRVGAIAAIGNTQLSGAFNLQRNLPHVPFGAQTVHAERACLCLVPYEKRDKVTLYVARIDSLGNIKPSKPCEKCAVSLIHEYHIKDVVFWNGISLERLSSSQLNQQYMSQSQVKVPSF